MFKSSRLSYAFASVCVLAACSSSKTKSANQPDAAATTKDAPAATFLDAPAPTTDPKIASRAAKSVCSALYRCCTTDLATYFAPFRDNTLLAAYKDRLPPAAVLDQAGCEQIVTEMFGIVPFGDWNKAVIAGEVQFDETAFTKCLSALDGATCGQPARDALFDSTCLGFSPPAGGTAQRSFVRRTRTTGASCSPLHDGIGGSFFGTCDPTVGFCCYADSAHPGCQYPFEASGTARPGQCQAAVATNATCSQQPPLALCATGSSCDSTADTCIVDQTTPIAVGDACIDTNYNILGVCQNSWCDVFGTSKCAALKTDGAACDSGEECVSQACQTTCVTNTLCTH